MKDEKEEIKPAPLKNYICLNCKNILYNQTFFPYACPECERKTFHEYPHGRSLGESSEEQKEPCPNCKETVDYCKCLRNKCRVCGNSVGNITFTVCDDCWDTEIKKKAPSPTSEPPEEQEDQIKLWNEVLEGEGSRYWDDAIKWCQENFIIHRKRD